MLIFLLGTGIIAIDVADVMPAVAESMALPECRPPSGTRSLYQPGSNFVNSAHVWTVNVCSLETEGGGPSENGAGRRFLIVRVFVVEIIFADIDHGQLP